MMIFLIILLQFVPAKQFRVVHHSSKTSVVIDEYNNFVYLPVGKSSKIKQFVLIRKLDEGERLREYAIKKEGEKHFGKLVIYRETIIFLTPDNKIEKYYIVINDENQVIRKIP